MPDGWRRVGRSVAGPAAQLALRIPMAATLIWEPTGDVWRSPNSDLVYPIWWIPGLIGVALALSNLIPIRGLGTDGAKILDGLRTVVVGKRSS